ncbi:MAG TPA: type 4a pilus biogenesis protein PilO [Candidatus Angelobacter sp.]|jgi:type IV pilus assembly protein PilO|nr:type 4a pilus biogenesis protein PilO [Candidatus Angelobacter sp.]
MAKIGELGFLAKAGILLVIFAAIGGTIYYFVLIPEYKKNGDLRSDLDKQQQENNRLRELEKERDKLRAQMVQLQFELDNEKKIVPADKDADEFIKLLHDNAASAGIEIRRYTAMPVSAREFYTEVPFQIDIDGPYYSVLNFFERLSKTDRIVNVNSLQMSNVANPGPSKVKTSGYTFAPGESVLASCTATTFFSRDLQEGLPVVPPVVPPKK